MSTNQDRLQKVCLVHIQGNLLERKRRLRHARVTVHFVDPKHFVYANDVVVKISVLTQDLIAS